MKTKLLSLLVALIATTALLASNTITYTATEKLPETTETYDGGLHTNAFNVSISSHTFSNGIGTITFAGEVTSIGREAFFDCRGLTSVTIPSSVTTIGKEAFRWCDDLTSITIPSSVTTIGEMAFEECTGLTSVTIPNSVTTIRESAFAYCSGLTSVTIPSSVTTIGQVAFYNVNNIVYSGTATGSPWGAKCMNGYIEGYLVYSDATKTTLCGCSSAATGAITIPSSVTTIGEEAFFWCDDLTSITIPSSVTTIGESAFSGCSGLTSITIPSSVTTIGYGTFEYCMGLTSVTIPNSVTTIGGSAFAYCRGLTSVTIPSSVTTIGESAFSGCRGLTSVTIGNSVTTIGESAFSGCYRLTSVTISSSVTTIGESAFSGCSGLTSVTIPSSVTTIGESAFSGCSGLTSVTIPSSVTTIGKDAFYNVNNIVYSGTATGSPWGAKCMNGYIEGYLVYSDANKTTLVGCFTAATGSITIPSSVTTIGDYAFDGCYRLTSVTINSNAICSKTYSSSSNIGNIFGSQVKEYIIGDSVNTIGSSAFLGCSGLTSVTIGNSVTTIGYDAFTDCSGLTSVTIGNSVTTIGGSAFYKCSGLKSVTIGNSVTTIGNDAFNGCSGLTSVTIPSSVATIGNSAFYGCNKITNLIFGSNLTTIGNSAFANCNRIDTMTIYAVEPPAITETTFKNVSRYAFLYVPQSSERKYKTDAYWSYFDIQTISAKNASISGDEVVVLPSTDNATFTWPQTDDADTYTLEIKKNGELVCILTFNSQGQLINIAFTLARNGERPANYATKTLTGYQFTITGLESGTAYTYAVTAKDASQQVLQTYSGDFTTTGGTATDLLPLPYEGKAGIGSAKWIKNGHLLIERNGILYNAHGARVR